MVYTSPFYAHTHFVSLHADRSFELAKVHFSVQEYHHGCACPSEVVQDFFEVQTLFLVNL